MFGRGGVCKQDRVVHAWRCEVGMDTARRMYAGALSVFFGTSRCCLVVTVEPVAGRGAARGRNSAVHSSRLEAEMAEEEEVDDEVHRGLPDDDGMVYDSDGGMGEKKEEEEREVTVGSSGNATR